MLEKLYIKMQSKMSFDPYLTLHMKVDTKWVTDLHVDPKTIKLKKGTKRRSLLIWAKIS